MKNSRAGFTLIELIAVIGIIAIMSVLVTGGYSGMMRSLGDKAGTDTIRRTLMLARQQACVDGVDMYFWIIGVDQYVICRKAGVITKTGDGSEEPSYMDEKVSSNWVYDDYADLVDSAQGLYNKDGDLSSSSQKDLQEKYAEQFANQYVFDITEGIPSPLEYPPWYDRKADTWVFGVQKSSGFKEGSEYAWVDMPVRQLPKGYVFAGSYDSNGEFKDNYGAEKYIRFLPDGTVKSNGDILVEEVSTKLTSTISIKQNGNVSIK